MGRNLLIKEFDVKLGNLINEALSSGVDISVVVLTLDKYLFSAQATENRIINEEKLIEMQAKMEVEKQAKSETEDEKENFSSINKYGVIKTGGKLPEDEKRDKLKTDDKMKNFLNRKTIGIPEGAYDE